MILIVTECNTLLCKGGSLALFGLSLVEPGKSNLVIHLSSTSRNRVSQGTYWMLADVDIYRRLTLNLGHTMSNLVIEGHKPIVQNKTFLMELRCRTIKLLRLTSGRMSNTPMGDTYKSNEGYIELF